MNDYYNILEVPASATAAQIRQAYVEKSLKWHPDRCSDPKAKENFQKVAEAYYTLSDQSRRNDYDRTHTRKGAADPEFATASGDVNASSVFSSVFEDMLAPELDNPTWFWEPIGLICGILLGMIIFNIPGACFGGYMGKKMGRVRDVKGKSVQEVFMSMDGGKKMQILNSLAKRMLQSAIS